MTKINPYTRLKERYDALEVTLEEVRLCLDREMEESSKLRARIAALEDAKVSYVRQLTAADKLANLVLANVDENIPWWRKPFSDKIAETLRFAAHSHFLAAFNKKP